MGLFGATHVSFDIYIGFVRTIINGELSAINNNGEDAIYILYEKINLLAVKICKFFEVFFAGEVVGTALLPVSMVCSGCVKFSSNLKLSNFACCNAVT